MPTPRRTRLYVVACVAVGMLVATSHVWCLSPLHRAGVDALQFQLDLDRLEEHIDILHGWFRRSRRRPRYSRREKLLILEHAERFSLSAAKLAHDFLLSPATAYRWLEQRRAVRAGAAPPPDPPKPVPPCTRICDSRRQAVGDMAVAGFDGNRTIHRSLLHQGEKISARSVGRIRAEPRRSSVPEPLAKKKSKEIPDSPCSPADVVDNKPGFVPRIGRLVRVLADAFIQGIATANLRLLDEIDDWHERDSLLALRARLRSRRAGQLAILLSRFARIPPGRRTHFNPAERARILDLKHGHRLSNRTLAPWFLVDEGTLSHWNRDVDHPEQRRRPLVQPLPNIAAAVAGIGDSLRFVPKRLRSLVSDTLATLAARTPVRRLRKRKASKPDTPPAAARALRKLSPIRARFPNHWWSCDLTTIELLHRFYLACVIDLYSRRVLAWDLYPGQPNAPQIQALFARAAAQHGAPKHVVTDQGKQFEGDAISSLLGGADHRLGAVRQHGSIATIERLWRSLKGYLDVRTVRPNVMATVRGRLATIIDFYNTKRPHSSLGGATPDEVYHGKVSRARTASKAPRGRRGEPCPPVPFVIRYAFPLDRKLPYLERAA